MFDALRTFYHITCAKNIYIEPFFIAKRTFYYVTVTDICNLLRLIKRGYGFKCLVSFFPIDIHVHMRFFPSSQNMPDLYDKKSYVWHLEPYII